MGNCHPCRMDSVGVYNYWTKKNHKEITKERRKMEKNQDVKNDKSNIEKNKSK